MEPIYDLVVSDVRELRPRVVLISHVIHSLVAQVMLCIMRKKPLTLVRVLIFVLALFGPLQLPLHNALMLLQKHLIYLCLLMVHQLYLLDNDHWFELYFEILIFIRKFFEKLICRGRRGRLQHLITYDLRRNVWRGWLLYNLLLLLNQFLFSLLLLFLLDLNMFFDIIIFL